MCLFICLNSELLYADATWKRCRDSEASRDIRSDRHVALPRSGYLHFNRKVVCILLDSTEYILLGNES